MSIKVRLSVAILGVAALAVALAGGLGLFAVRALISQVEMDRAERARDRFFVAVERRAQVNESVARLIASWPVVSAHLRNDDRAGLIADLGEAFDGLKSYGANYVHFHRPNTTTLARLHAPDRYDDDLSEIRPLIADVNRHRTPRNGVERGPAGLAIRGAVPVTDSGRHVGVAEVGSFIDAEFLNSIADHYAAYTVFVAAGGKLERVMASANARAPRLDAEMLQSTPVETLAMAHASADGSAYLLTAMPLYDYGSVRVGVVQVDIDTTGLENAYQMALGLLLLGTAVLALLAALAAVLTGQGILRPLERLVRATQDIAADRPAASVPLLHRNDELGRFAQAIDQFRTGKQELREARDRAQQANTALERRTADLEAANRQLGEQAVVLERLNDRYHAEREAARTATRLLQDVIDTVPAVINFKGPDLRYVVVNRACAKFYQRTKEEMIGKRISDMASGLDMEALERAERRVIETGEALLPRDFTGVSASGRFETWWTVKAPFRNADGGIAGLVTVAMDITDVKDAQAILERRTADLEEANRRLEAQAVALERLNEQYHAEREAALQASRAKSEFLAIMSHELRTPLNAVIGYSEVLTGEMFGPLQLRYREYANDILVSGRHLLEVINDILDMARIEAGSQTMLVAETDLAETIRSAVRFLQWRVDQKRQDLRMNIASNLPVTRIDPRAIRQVILNVVGNALKFTGVGGRIDVDLRLRPDRWVEIAVRDTGPGIAAEHLPHVFTPFWQAAEARSRVQEGTGLGLAISKKLVEMHDGVIEIASTPGEGTVVRIRLPPSCVVAA